MILKAFSNPNNSVNNGQYYIREWGEVVDLRCEEGRDFECRLKSTVIGEKVHAKYFSSILIELKQRTGKIGVLKAGFLKKIAICVLHWDE